MQKLKFIHLGTILIVLSVVSCENKKNTPEFKEYSIDSLGYSIAVPSDWTLKKRDIHRYAFSFYEPKTCEMDSFSENITIWMEPLPIKISDSLYAKTNIGQFKITQPNIIIKEEAPIDGINRRLYPFSFSINEKGTHYSVQGYTCVKDTLAYNLSCTYPTSKQDDYKPLFKKIINSFKTH